MNSFATTRLQRGIRASGALFLTLSCVTPAASVFILAPGVVQQAGTGAILCLLVALVVNVMIAFVYAELASAFPLTGGEYAIVGRLLGPLPGFIVLGINFAGSILTVAVFALGLSQYLSVLIPDLPPIAVGIGCVVVTTLSGILNIRTNALVTGLFLLIELVALLVLAWLGATHISRNFADFLTAPVNLVSDHLKPVTIAAFGLAFVNANFVYTGFGNAVYLGEEIREAPRHIGRTIIAALLISAIAEVVPIAAVLLGAPDLSKLLSSSSMFSDFIVVRGGEGLNRLVSLGIALAIVNANIAFLVMVARQLYSISRDQVLSPVINRALMRVHPRFHSPYVATLACGGLATLACLIPLDFLLILAGTGIIVIYASLCLAVFFGRRRGHLKHGHYRMPWFPWPPILGFLALGYVMVVNLGNPDFGRPSLVATACTVFASVVYYAVALGRRGAWILRGPDEPA
jgi:amino acid transporter